MAWVLNDTPELLLSGGDRQGEPALRMEIARYVYTSRGVICTPEQVVVSAGTQQLTSHLARLLRRMGIDLVCTEEPGYLPVINAFRDWGFGMSRIPVGEDSIVIEKLPVNVRTAVYVSPQNQFPTGAVMPISRRRQLLDWARANDSVIIEDDYNSELRYFGRPIPALQGLDQDDLVVYLGSFSSTLFPAVRISYMVLPGGMAEDFARIKEEYDQTCSKTEQLTLALFMQKGYYRANLRRVRKLYSRKLQAALGAIRRWGGTTAGEPCMTARDTRSGLSIILRVQAGEEDQPRLLRACRELGLNVSPLPEPRPASGLFLIFYYNQIPLAEIDGAVRELAAACRRIAAGSLAEQPAET